MSCMGIIMKGVLKGFNKRIAHFFVVKEREIEIEIGGPTDVKHVGHIGWDGPAGSAGNGAPSWMSEFKTGANFASTSIGRNSGNAAKALTPWTSPPEPRKATIDDSTTPRKPRRKKKKKPSNSSPGPSSTSSSSTKPGGGSSGTSSSSKRRRRPKTRLAEGHANKT